jgi:hypothetical protein
LWAESAVQTVVNGTRIHAVCDSPFGSLTDSHSRPFWRFRLTPFTQYSVEPSMRRSHTGTLSPDWLYVPSNNRLQECLCQLFGSVRSIDLISAPGKMGRSCAKLSIKNRRMVYQRTRLLSTDVAGGRANRPATSTGKRRPLIDEQPLACRPSPDPIRPRVLREGTLTMIFVVTYNRPVPHTRRSWTQESRHFSFC